MTHTAANIQETPTYYVRDLDEGMGVAVAERTILRDIPEGGKETWADVSHRVALGNSMLTFDHTEYQSMYKHITQGSLLMSGRHLQHSDANQPHRNIDVFSNCSTSATTFALFYMLLNGSGVGRSYDDCLMVVDWRDAPNVVVLLDNVHPDWKKQHQTKYDVQSDILHQDSEYFLVPDSREGWAKAVEIWETMTFNKQSTKTLYLDFSNVRGYGEPICGMQNRPASGPVPLMDAFMKAASITRTHNMQPWMMAMFIDHYFAECVVVGGARRAARIAVKHWKDASIKEFITLKSPNDTIANTYGVTDFLWSANNSIGTDEEYEELVGLPETDPRYNSDLAKHARMVWNESTLASYEDGTGEPGFINLHKLVKNNDGLENYVDGEYVGYDKYTVDKSTNLLLQKLAKIVIDMPYNMIVNPCGEIPLNILCGICVIADVVPYHADSLDDAEDAFRTAARALIRVNLMEGMYSREIHRTNRIGVGMTGMHEFAWKFFKVGFKYLINPDFDACRNLATNAADLRTHTNPRIRSAAFWMTLNRFGRAVVAEADAYSDSLGVSHPHTALTIKPAGTTSKLFGVTEGSHLPSKRFYLRWVQFRNDDPLVNDYKKSGYPTKELSSYNDTTIIGFPTKPTIMSLGMGDELVTASEATPEEQYKWLILIEKYYMVGVDSNFDALSDRSGQVSYTLKYSRDDISLNEFRSVVRKYQPQVKCCSVLPETDGVYEYMPEEPITEMEYETLMTTIKNVMPEDIGKEHVECEGGACPIDFMQGSKSDL